MATGRRRRWTDARKVRFVEESYTAPRMAAATARRYEIFRSLLTRWRRDARLLQRLAKTPSSEWFGLRDLEPDGDDDDRRETGTD
ncbi:hypothetical protein E4L95_05920 [Paracoccus liaowanqingii]|uniref:Transposase n=1 Tax=Paracoccus liaowanqingii TaxID=2560053 RepID=A0A4Z1CQA2_9RHOB|nr:transposase [Paracoccus liaowanqingii]TGN67180.1 hypothetical protein E4L95_05920 [Paracoccus liaowanqingii]